jgi:hypothetical protein
MSTPLKYTIAIITGIVIGSGVNMAIIMMSSSVIPPPEGTDLTTVEGLKAAQDLLTPKHFIMPFLAHALGTFVGALLAGLISIKNNKFPTFFIGLFFLLGGIYASTQIPAPSWFIAVDLMFAYLPTAILAQKIVGRRK